MSLKYLSINDLRHLYMQRAAHLAACAGIYQREWHIKGTSWGLKIGARFLPSRPCPEDL